MTTPRLRIIAGPNGSGKTTLTRFLQQAYSLSFGIYINADDIERRLRTELQFSFSDFNLTVTEKQVKEFFTQHPLNKNTLQNTFSLEDGILKMMGAADGYFTAILADFLRRALIQKKESFSFETVMSGEDKIQLMHEAHRNGYRNYLYYICTDNVRINKERVAGRVLMGEHPVPEDKIASRYTRSLHLLLDAIKASDRAYLFDNTGQSHELLAEVTNGTVIDPKTELMPGWFMEAVVNKL